MVILTIDEAATLLRITRRTLYRHTEIPRVRIGHKIMFLRSDLEAWVHSRREPCPKASEVQTGHDGENKKVDEVPMTPYHRNPIFRLPSARGV
jgi:excisionase family DNA binding protein